ncbi:MAG: hypothetical protein L3J71_00510 [Victivallaceae bacterium]|nr:hypothetical protein [Victivallaceae bacterium]
MHHKPKLPARENSKRINKTKDLINAIVQRKDPILRKNTLNKLQVMLSPQSSEQQQILALAALHSSLTAKFDRTPFRTLILPLLKSKNAKIRTVKIR